jgi:hypothetical protein
MVPDTRSPRPGPTMSRSSRPCSSRASATARRSPCFDGAVRPHGPWNKCARLARSTIFSEAGTGEGRPVRLWAGGSRPGGLINSAASTSKERGGVGSGFLDGGRARSLFQLAQTGAVDARAALTQHRQDLILPGQCLCQSAEMAIDLLLDGGIDADFGGEVGKDADQFLGVGHEDNIVFASSSPR